MSARTSLRAFVGSTRSVLPACVGPIQAGPSRPASTQAASLLPLPRKSKSKSQFQSQAESKLPSAPVVNPDRVYPERKAYLHAYYSHLLRTSQLVLLFSHDNLSIPNLGAIRRAIAKIPVPVPASGASAASSDPTSAAPAAPDGRAKLTITRTGLLSALFKPNRLASPSDPSFLPYLNYQTALLTSPSINPAYLTKVLAAISRAVRQAKKDIPPNTPPEKVKQPRLTLVAGILEGNRLVGVQELEQVGKLPDLDTLRAQVVGLLEGQGRGLLGVLSQAGGGGLLRTLQGLEEGLKNESGQEDAKA